jgi:ABC-type branched-subunit amino acid transport system ATPase component/branched-subunit amino acid ABC-type transport system permease component
VTLFLQYVVLGIGAGGGYVLLSQGLIVTYAGSGVLNFAQAAIGTFGGYWYWQWHQQDAWPVWLAILAAASSMALLGAFIHMAIMRPLRHSSIAQVIATLGIFTALGGVINLNWGPNDQFVAEFLPRGTVTLGGVFLGIDRLVLLGVAIFSTVVLWAVYRYTRIGLAIRASSSSRFSVATLGWSHDLLATLSWALGAFLTTLGIIYVSSLSGLSPGLTPLLIFPMLATGLIGGFSSFPLTLAGGLALGVFQSVTTGYVSLIGAQDAIPLLVIIVLLVVRGKGVSVRKSEKLPAVGSGHVRWPLAIVLFATVGILVTVVFNNVRLIDSISISASWATVMLSVVVLLGFTGQLSFEQVAMAGIAALIAGRLTLAGAPFLLSFSCAVVTAVPIGLLFAMPAVRTKGINLAVVTLGLATTAAAILFANPKFIGSNDGTPIAHRQRLFGLSIDPTRYPERYCMFSLACFALCGLTVTNIRRGRAGRRLIAVRTNENAAAAIGISVFGTKLYAFSVGCTVASIGGVLLAFQNGEVVYSFFDPFNSALAVVWTVIGGVGYVLGPIFAAPLAPGGIGTWVADLWWPNGHYWLSLIGGLAVILVLLQDPNGIASMNIKSLYVAEGEKQSSKLAYLRLEVAIVTLWQLVRRRLFGPPKLKSREALGERIAIRVPPMTLHASGIDVRYGGVCAVDNVSLTVEPGEVVGLIGPNGAGKTSLINAIAGSVRPAAGELLLDGKSILGMLADRRSRAGLGRTFQSLELFESLTVRENLRVASDRRDIKSYFTDIVRPRTTPLNELAVAAVHEFELEPHLDTEVDDLPYGLRHLASIARAIAAGPSILLLDEPAAGLSGNEARELVRTVRGLAREWGMAILVVEHDMNFVMEACDRVVVLNFGRKIAEGTPHEIRSNPEVIASYLGEERTETPEIVDIASRPT